MDGFLLLGGRTNQLGPDDRVLSVPLTGFSGDTVYLVLREKGTESTTKRALKSLREDFVDWNEVRVSRAAEPDAATMCASALFIVVLLRRAREQNGRAGETKTGTTSCWT